MFRVYMWFVSTLRWFTAHFKPDNRQPYLQCAKKHTYFAYGTGELSAWVVGDHEKTQFFEQAADG